MYEQEVIQLLKSETAYMGNVDDNQQPRVRPMRAYVDKEGRRWRFLDVRELLMDERFMDIGA